MQASTSEAVSAAATTLQNVLLDKEAQHLVAELHGVRIIAGLLHSTDLVLLARATGMHAAMDYTLSVVHNLVAELHEVRIIAGLLHSTDWVLLAKATGMHAAIGYILSACCTARTWSFLLELQVCSQQWITF